MNPNSHPITPTSSPSPCYNLFVHSLLPPPSQQQQKYQSFGNPNSHPITPTPSPGHNLFMYALQPPHSQPTVSPLLYSCIFSCHLSLTSYKRVHPRTEQWLVMDRTEQRKRVRGLCFHSCWLLHIFVPIFYIEVSPWEEQSARETVDGVFKADALF